MYQPVDKFWLFLSLFPWINILIWASESLGGSDEPTATDIFSFIVNSLYNVPVFSIGCLFKCTLRVIALRPKWILLMLHKLCFYNIRCPYSLWLKLYKLGLWNFFIYLQLFTSILAENYLYFSCKADFTCCYLQHWVESIFYLVLYSYRNIAANHAILWNP